MWLYYWLASHGIDPTATRTVTVPPPQMVANMRIGNVDGFCVGEPWNARAIIDKLGFSAATSQDIWPDHPEKVLRSEEHTSELQSLMRISYAVFCLKKKIKSIVLTSNHMRTIQHTS